MLPDGLTARIAYSPDVGGSGASDKGTSVTYIDINATGFQLTDNNSRTNENGSTYIYMAIRRGGMQTPTAASDVFQRQDSQI